MQFTYVKVCEYDQENVLKVFKVKFSGVLVLLGSLIYNYL